MRTKILNINHPFTALFLLIIAMAAITSCSAPKLGLFSKKTPHEEYEATIRETGLHKTALGTKWLNAASKALSVPLSVQLPYKETGYFAAERPASAGFVFNARKGEKINISIALKPDTGFLVFADLWKYQNPSAPDRLESADTLSHNITHEADKDGSYLLRIQPELLRSGEYTVTITTGPSLAFPAPAGNRSSIGSFWGDNRDNGSRKHEGIDIFGKFRSPVVAAADGYVTSVREGGIGGKVVFVRPSGKDYTLYYAHLDQQIATEGQSVRTGDTVGLMGNTGNAKYTPTHLHFGIYTNGGAVDPLPFIDGRKASPKAVSASLNVLNAYVRNSKPVSIFSEPGEKNTLSKKALPNTPMLVLAATDSWYKIMLPDGQQGFVPGNSVIQANNPLRKYNASVNTLLLDSASAIATPKNSILKGASLNVLGEFDGFYLVENDGLTGWIVK